MASYTLGMKTAISLPDGLFQRAEEMADRLGTSRSDLYRQALIEFLDRHDPQAVSCRMDAALEEIGDQSDRFVDAAAGETLRGVEW